MNIIDRRLNPGGKNLPNRQRFLRRARKIVRDAVRKASAGRGIRDVDEAGVVVIPADGIDEPYFHLGDKGFHRPVFPGNKEFVEGERLPRPPGSGRGGRGPGAGEGKSEDEYRVALSAEEFLEFFLEDLELPDLERRQLTTTETEGVRRAGYSIVGSPSSLSVPRTMRNSLSRRIALKRPNRDDLRAAEEALAEIEARGGDEEERDAALLNLETLQRKSRTIAWIDPIDIRYRRFEPIPKPSSQAVMFCLMDVSASMSEHMKDLAKRFFMLLHVFLERRYKQVDVVFVRHTSVAEEVDEETFFYSRETGGTVVSSALEEMLRIARERYPLDTWNIYAAQASDGDNYGADSGRCVDLLGNEILPLCQYFAYIEVGDASGGLMRDSDLWRSYSEVAPGHKHFAMRRVADATQIFPVFHDLFAKDRVRA
jgi:hypothetical protein